MSKPVKFEQVICSVCSEEFSARDWGGGAKQKTCSARCRAKISSATMAAMNRKYAPARMRAHNPMHRGDNKQRMVATLRAMGHKPKVRGGNGKGATAAEEAISRALGWPMQVIVNTGHCRDGSGYPPHYKLDVANEELKVAVEVDGGSHSALSRKAQDAKKDAFLRGLGWIVLRVSNRQALEELPSTISRLKALIPTSRTGS